jgi:hypothetical protein
MGEYRPDLHKASFARIRTIYPDHIQRRQASSGPSRSSNPKRAGELEISTSEDGCIVCRPGHDRIHFLNPTAVLILEFCNGENSLADIVDLVKQAYGLPEAPVQDVREVLGQLKAEGLLL